MSTNDTLREALETLRAALDPDDWIGEVTMHAFIDAALAEPVSGGAVVLPEPIRGEEMGQYGNAMRRGFEAFRREFLRLNPGIEVAALNGGAVAEYQPERSDNWGPCSVTSCDNPVKPFNSGFCKDHTPAQVAAMAEPVSGFVSIQEAWEAAGGVRDKWGEYKEKFCGCKDGSRLNSCRGLPNCELRPDHPERKASPICTDDPEFITPSNAP